MTDKKRIEILKITKKIITGTGGCICPILEELAGVFGFTYAKLRELFPELKKYKPKNKKIDDSWWDVKDKAIRIKILNSMITEIKSKSND